MIRSIHDIAVLSIRKIVIVIIWLLLFLIFGHSSVPQRLYCQELMPDVSADDSKLLGARALRRELFRNSMEHHRLRAKEELLQWRLGGFEQSWNIKFSDDEDSPEVIVQEVIRQLTSQKQRGREIIAVSKDLELLSQVLKDQGNPQLEERLRAWLGQRRLIPNIDSMIIVGKYNHDLQKAIEAFLRKGDDESFEKNLYRASKIEECVEQFKIEDLGISEKISAMSDLDTVVLREGKAAAKELESASNQSRKNERKRNEISSALFMSDSGQALRLAEMTHFEKNVIRLSKERFMLERNRTSFTFDIANETKCDIEFELHVGSVLDHFRSEPKFPYVFQSGWSLARGQQTGRYEPWYLYRGNVGMVIRRVYDKVENKGLDKETCNRVITEITPLLDTEKLEQMLGVR